MQKHCMLAQLRHTKILPLLLPSCLKVSGLGSCDRFCVISVDHPWCHPNDTNILTSWCPLWRQEWFKSALGSRTTYCLFNFVTPDCSCTWMNKKCEEMDIQPVYTNYGLCYQFNGPGHEQLKTSHPGNMIEIYALKRSITTQLFKYFKRNCHYPIYHYGRNSKWPATHTKRSRLRYDAEGFERQWNKGRDKRTFNRVIHEG